MKIGEAATESFRLWVPSKRQNRQRDVERMRKAVDEMDSLREDSKI